jgi:hypothetical protein
MFGVFGMAQVSRMHAAKPTNWWYCIVPILVLAHPHFGEGIRAERARAGR